jgi:hypothetical protein
MAGLFDIVVAFVRDAGWACSTMGLPGVLFTTFNGQNGTWDCYFRVDEDDEQVAFYSECPLPAPPDRRLPMAEFLTRANYGLTIGNFEMNVDDGAIRFKTSLDVEGDRLSAALAAQLVYHNVGALDLYLPGIQAIVAGATPGEALARVEGVVGDDQDLPMSESTTDSE